MVVVSVDEDVEVEDEELVDVEELVVEDLDVLAVVKVDVLVGGGKSGVVVVELVEKVVVLTVF